MKSGEKKNKNILKENNFWEKFCEIDAKMWVKCHKFRNFILTQTWISCFWMYTFGSSLLNSLRTMLTNTWSHTCKSVQNKTKRDSKLCEKQVSVMYFPSISTSSLPKSSYVKNTVWLPQPDTDLFYSYRCLLTSKIQHCQPPHAHLFQAL